MTSPDHDYLSTACWHAEVDGDDRLHDYCASPSGRQGPKTPGVCKWCAARCRCRCHHREQERAGRWRRLWRAIKGRIAAQQANDHDRGDPVHDRPRLGQTPDQVGSQQSWIEGYEPTDPGPGEIHE